MSTLHKPAAALTGAVGSDVWWLSFSCSKTYKCNKIRASEILRTSSHLSCPCLFDLLTFLSRTPAMERVDGRNGEQVRPLRYHLNPQTDIPLTPPQKEVTRVTAQTRRHWLFANACSWRGAARHGKPPERALRETTQIYVCMCGEPILYF